MAILARYLSPSDFGLMAIVTVVIGFSSLFMDMGLSSAIIHRQDISSEQLSSLYWLNIGSGFILTIIVFFLSNYIAVFYHENELESLIRILSLTFLISAIGNQYRVLYQKELLFDVLAKVEISSALLGFLVSIILAIQGVGVYSLVYATLIKISVANCLFFIVGVKKHIPQLHFNISDIRNVVSFGLFQMGERSINYFNSQFDTILIGKLLGTESLGIYTVAKTLMMKPAQIINPIITKVTFPVMSKVQSDEPQLKRIYLKTINYLCSINSAIYIIIAFLAEPIVLLLFGHKWSPAVPLIQILAGYYILRAIGNPIGALQLAKGRADLGFYWNLMLFMLFPISIYFGSYYGVYGVAYSLIILMLVFTIPNWYFMVKPLCGANFKEYFNNIIKPIFLATIPLFPISIFIEISENIDFNLIMFVFFYSIGWFCINWKNGVNIRRSFLNG
jgi:O-antigen/teichoic acid export membrane protein